LGFFVAHNKKTACYPHAGEDHAGESNPGAAGRGLD
jgi:hypothetical protein